MKFLGIPENVQVRYAFPLPSPRKTCFIQIDFCDFASLFYRRRTSVNRTFPLFEGIKDYIVLNPSTPKESLFSPYGFFVSLP